MKIIIIIYLLFVHVLLGMAILKSDIISRFQVKFGYEVKKAELTPHYHMMVAFHQRVDKNIPEHSIIFIGDSLIQGLAVTAISPKSVNFGIGQDTTEGVLKRIPFYHSILQSKMIILSIGVNDLNRRDNDEIVSNYRKIIDLIPDNVPLLFSAVLPVDEEIINITGINERIVKLNDHLKKLCGGNQRLHYLNISKLLIDDDGNLSKDYHIGDGIHLNSLGNRIWISKLQTYSQRLAK